MSDTEIGLPEPTLAEPTHRVAWTIEGDWIGGAITCSAPVGSDCRLVCDHDCETWPCGGEGHSLVDAGECNAALWIHETGLAESHGGDGSETVRDGRVDVWWTGTAWMWAYRKEEG